MTRRNKSRRRIKRRTVNQTNMIGVLTIVVILIGLLMFFTSQIQNERILRSYCGDFGFYGKKLTLMRDGTFSFAYHGCSLVKGVVYGSWTQENEIIILVQYQSDEHLDRQYQQVNDQLVPINFVEGGFVVCDENEDALQNIE